MQCLDNSRKLESTLDPCVLVRKVAGCLDSPLSGQFRHVRSLEEYDKLLELPFDPRTYTDAKNFSGDYLLRSILAKYNPVSNVDRDLDAPTLEKFLSVEKDMEAANHRINLLWEKSPASGLFEPDVCHVLLRARDKIRDVLGLCFPRNALLDLCEFSSGASVTRTRPSARRPRNGSREPGCSPEFKYGNPEPSVTRNCLPLACQLVLSSPIWRANVKGFKIVRGNKIATVAKNRKINRTIAIEPDLNMFIQKGIGRFIRRSLKYKMNIDLNNQTINQNLARLGSVDGSLATIDLSSASDSVSTALVNFLLPEEWVDVLQMARSPEGELPDGTYVQYEKISSMGNGFTFELESLIFASICWAICKPQQTFSVYGDDIIIPCEHVPLLEKVLSFVGFKFNKDKSFYSGPFRESCGKHYFLGEDVTPIYHRTPGITSTEKNFQVILLANGIFRFSARRYTDALEKVYLWVISHLPPFWAKPRICEGVGDGALIGPFDRVLPQGKPNGFQRTQFTVKVLIRSTREARYQPTQMGCYLTSLGKTCNGYSLTGERRHLLSDFDIKSETLRRHLPLEGGRSTELWSSYRFGLDRCRETSLTLEKWQEPELPPWKLFKEPS